MLKICKHTFYAYLSRIRKMMQFFIRKVFATKILLSGKLLFFLTLSIPLPFGQHMVIPDICQFWYTTALYMPVKSTPKSAYVRNKIAKTGCNRQKCRVLYAEKCTSLKKVYHCRLCGCDKYQLCIWPSFDTSNTWNMAKNRNSRFVTSSTSAMLLFYRSVSKLLIVWFA